MKIVMMMVYSTVDIMHIGAALSIVRGDSDIGKSCRLVRHRRAYRKKAAWRINGGISDQSLSNDDNGVTLASS